MIWCGVSTNATAMDEYGAYLKQNSDAITAIAPTIWHLAQDSQSLTADDAIMAATAKLKKQSGVRVIPTVFDNESYNQGTLKPRLLKLFANPHKFINAIVWDNVNACGNGNQHLLETAYILKLAPLAELFASFGISSFLTPCLTSPMTVGPHKL